MSILLGFEIPSGVPVRIPDEGHLAWFGQTQLSGKTTALEAMVFRGHLKACAFITKQGEGAFLTGRMIQPYFSEPTNDEEQPLWRWVKSILEASQQRRMNFEESWIIRATEDPRQAKSLADVHANIKALLGGEGGYVEKGRGKKKKKEWKYSRKPVSGMNAGVYTSLKAYFDIVMPQLARLPYTKKLDLHPGLNVMDLREYAMETQALVIRSVMEWVYQHEKGVRVIVPESQDFVPQGKNSPVKMACETLVRKAGANKNFMWLDSQDMAAVDKVMLRACSIVGCGVQTEMHEIDRTLASMFTPALRPLDIAKLKVGEFFVRTPEARVSKVYVMPAWMDSEIHAQSIAKGEVSVETARLMFRAYKQSHKPAPSSPAPHQLLQIQTQERDDENDSHSGNPSHSDRAGIPKKSGANASVLETVSGTFEDGRESENEAMWREKYEALEAEHKTLIDAHDKLAERLRQLEAREGSRRLLGVADSIDHAINEHREAVKSSDGNGLSLTVPQLDYIYKYTIARAEKDPGILELLRVKPELHVKVERQIVSVHGNQIDGQICKLIVDHFLEKPQDRQAIGAELVRRGALKRGTNLKILSPALAKLSHLGFLTVEATGYQAVLGMKVEIRE